MREGKLDSDITVPGSENTLTRKQMLKIAGLGSAGLAVISVVGIPAASAESKPQAQVYGANAKGLIMTDTGRCVGCRRCELACTEFNEGVANPVLARIQVGRNLLFGPKGAGLGIWRGEGKFGNLRVIQDTCKQCPHPIPCQLACPQGAIEISGEVNARVVNQEKCVGCRICQEACPWEMTRFNEEAGKATKCHLCGGDPKCVAACPTGAIQYVPWVDMTDSVPQRFIVPAYITAPANVTETCMTCHSKKVG